MRYSVASTLAAIVLLSCSRAAPDKSDAPPVFAALSFDDAVARTVDTNKILVVKSTASWCQPCKLMDKTTWRDERVVAWFKDNGLAIHFDVDEQAALARTLDIQAMPTMIAFVKGKEFDRIVGYKPAAEFLIWLEGVKRGERAIEAVKSRASNAPKGSEEEVDSRYDLAKQFALKGELDRATEEYAWLWVNSAETPGYGGVRGSFMASDMQRLASRHPPARERFLVFRNEAGERLKQDKVDRNDLDDWVVLNDVVGESSKTLEWFDLVKAEPRLTSLISSIEFRLAGLLEAQGRWSDMAALYPDPMEKLKSAHQMLEMSRDRPMPDMPKEQLDQMRSMDEEMFRDTAGKLHAVLLAASQEDNAMKIADESLKLDDSSAMRLALVRWALNAKEPRARHRELLDAAQQMDAKASTKSLRNKLEKSLAAQPAH
jgi:thioredoxin-like negative regulator of GroEL